MVRTFAINKQPDLSPSWYHLSTSVSEGGGVGPAKLVQSWALLLHDLILSAGWTQLRFPPGVYRWRYSMPSSLQWRDGKVSSSGLSGASVVQKISYVGLSLSVSPQGSLSTTQAHLHYNCTHCCDSNFPLQESRVVVFVRDPTCTGLFHSPHTSTHHSPRRPTPVCDYPLCSRRGFHVFRT